ncbi:MAG: hypothetical protein P1U42_04365 [Phycisphaerales bacterium]|nr:hypothetical protein [Phycisphaerales bacterium]
MSEPTRNINPSSKAPQITSLSIAFPMNFESQSHTPSNDPRRVTPAANDTTRPPHRHDAGE